MDEGIAAIDEHDAVAEERLQAVVDVGAEEEVRVETLLAANDPDDPTPGKMVFIRKLRTSASPMEVPWNVARW